MNVIVIGGGLAGLSAAAELVEQGAVVTILEVRSVLGGKATSWTDADRDTIEVGLHVPTLLYTELLDLMGKVGATEHLVWRDRVYTTLPKVRAPRSPPSDPRTAHGTRSGPRHPHRQRTGRGNPKSRALAASIPSSNSYSTTDHRSRKSFNASRFQIVWMSTRSCTMMSAPKESWRYRAGADTQSMNTTLTEIFRSRGMRLQHRRLSPV